jgi:hypothetical protein
MSQEVCILRREIIALIQFQGKCVRTFSKCVDCLQGNWIIKNYPVPGLDNDVFKLKFQYGIKVKKIKLKPKIKLTKKIKLIRINQLKEYYANIKKIKGR